MNISFDQVREVVIENYKNHYKTIIVRTQEQDFEIDLHGTVEVEEIAVRMLANGVLFSEDKAKRDFLSDEEMDAKGQTPSEAYRNAH